MARRDLDEWLWQVGAELQRLSEEITPGAPKVARRTAWEPRIDLLETKDAFIIKAEIAGVRGDEIRISYQAKRHSVTIRGVRRDEDLAQGGQCGYHQLEIAYGEFEREIHLPKQPIQAEAIRATYRNGVLIVTIPQSDVEQGEVVVRRSITITQL
jgi:HSP20 family protein